MTDQTDRLIDEIHSKNNLILPTTQAGRWRKFQTRLTYISCCNTIIVLATKAKV